MKSAVLLFLEAIFVPNSNFGTLKESIVTGKWESVWALVVNVYNNIAMPVALFFLILWFVKAVLDNTMLFRGNPEQIIFKPLIKFVIGFIVMKYGLDLVINMMDVGTGLVTQLTSNGSGAVMDATQRATMYGQMFPNATFVANNGVVELTKMGMIEAVGALAMLLIPYAGAVITQFIIFAVVSLRQLEMYIRVAFAPIALSDIYAEGSSGAGWRYLKAFFALSIQGVMLYFVSILGSYIFAAIVINGNQSGGLMSMIIPVLGVLLAQVTAIGKTGSISKELLGV